MEINASKANKPMNPKVSVIVPNYNHASYLKQRIDSILNQTFQDFEVIILDDCSTDNSLEVLSHYKNHNKVSHCVFNDTNSGNPFKQWDKGIQLAKGEWIWIAESDDWAEPEFLETINTHLRNCNNCGLIYTSSRLVDAEGCIRFSNSNNNDGSIKVYNGEKFIAEKLSTVQ